MDNKRKKMIAPIIITIIMILYLAFYFSVLSFMPVTFMIKIIFLVVPLASMGVIMYVLCVRIKEIRSGEEDDLSEY